ncbi:MAG TPA: type II toxin-antitoxin system HicA family toxin, partial [Nitrolancea sp.]|nr:type II toxin-antitoxin system HicA family toxin [Nitrolancea sp.]
MRAVLESGGACTVKVREVIRILEQDGWRQVRTTGSHRHYRHPIKPGTVTVPGSPNDDLPIGTLNSVLK